MNNIIKSPLRYPGGKSRLAKSIVSLIPSFEEYREPFLGGGSIYVYLKQIYPDSKYWHAWNARWLLSRWVVP